MTESSPKPRAVTALAMLLGGYSLFGGFISFLGWALDVRRLTDWFNDDVSIQPNACLLMMLSGAAVVLVQWRAWRTATLLGALAGLGGALILLQYIVGADFGLNHQLLFGRTWGQHTTVTPGRVGPPASTSFTLIGIAIVLLGWAALQPRHARLRRFVPMLGVAICAFMSFSLLGYLFRAEEFYSIPWLTAIALPTASMLFAVGIGLILSVPEHHPLLLLYEDSGAGKLARLTIPTLMVMIPLVQWLRIEGYEQGYFDIGTGRALGALTLVVAAISIFWVALMVLRHHEQALRDADRRKDEFLATLAHELRNPLAPVISSLEILERISGDEAVATNARAVMQRQLKQMVRLIDDLLDVSRISRGTIQLQKERVEFRSIIDQTVEAIGPICQAVQQKITLDLPPQRVWIEADPVRLGQVLGNLLRNACRYSPTGAEIAIRASCEDDDLVVSVKDHGIGIPPDKLEIIFQMFSQLDRSLERTSGGLGIGLYLVERLVNMHGGTVRAHSAGPGKGSEFIVRIPAITQPPSGVESTAPSRFNGTSVECRRVLVVDDNKDAAGTLSMLLEALGHETQTVHDGLQAVQAAERFNPQVILLDIGLPQLNGYEACEQIRSQPWGKDMFVVALTGWGQEEDKRRAQNAGFDAHFVKPIGQSQLTEILASVAKAHVPTAGSMAHSAAST